MCKYCRPLGSVVGTLGKPNEIVTIENVIPENECARVVADKFLSNEKRLRQTVGRRLHRIGQLYAPTRAIAE